MCELERLLAMQFLYKHVLVIRWGSRCISIIYNSIEKPRLGGLELDWTRVNEHVEREKSPAKDLKIQHVFITDR